MKRKHIWLLRDPQKNAGQRAATSRPPPGAATGACPGSHDRALGAGAVEVLRDRRNHAYAPARKTVSRHSAPATAAAPEAMIAHPDAGARRAESQVAGIAMTYSQGTVSGGVNNRRNADIQRLPEPSRRRTGRRQRPTGARSSETRKKTRASGRRPAAHPPGQPRALAPGAMIAPSARERSRSCGTAGIMPYAPARKTVSRHSAPATAAAPEAMIAHPDAGARRAESQVAGIAMTYSQGTVSGGVNNRRNADIQRLPEPSRRRTGRRQRPTGARCSRAGGPAPRPESCAP